ncbi:MAG: BatD family protein [Candidatus Omnitrophota bacterium]
MKRFNVKCVMFSIFLLYALHFTHYTAFAKEINFELSVDRAKVSLREPFYLNLVFNQIQDLPTLSLPDKDAFSFQYLGPSTNISMINGVTTSSLRHAYRALALKTGTFQIGPLQFEHKGDTYVSNPVTIEVVQGAVNNSSQAGGSQQKAESQDISDKAFLVIQAKKNKAYLNEPVPVTIKLYVNRLELRDFEALQVSHEGLFLGEFEKVKQYYDVLGSVRYEVVEFNTYVFGTRLGEFKIGPASIKCNMVVRSRSRRSSGFDDFFGSSIFDDLLSNSQLYPITLKSTDIPMTIMPLPETNKPKDFSGVIGDFNFDVSIKPAEVKVGDPITLLMLIRGEGNFSTIKSPKLESEAGFKIYDPEIKQEKGQKVFEQVIMPMNENIKEVPAVSFNFFNTQTGEYQNITKGPFPITVLKPEKEEKIKIVEPSKTISPPPKEEELGRDIIYIKETPGNFNKKGSFLYKDKLFLWLQIIPLLSYILLFIFHKRSVKLKTDLRYARQLQASGKAKKGVNRAKAFLLKSDTKCFYDSIFQTLQQYLGDKLHLPSKGITISIIDDYLKVKQVPEDILDMLRSIFKDCDMARYAASEFNKGNMQESLKKLEEVIDYFQRQRI